MEFAVKKKKAEFPTEGDGWAFVEADERPKPKVRGWRYRGVGGIGDAFQRYLGRLNAKHYKKPKSRRTW